MVSIRNIVKASCLLTACCLSISFATPSTQIWIPSTDIQAFGKMHLGWDAYVNTQGSGVLSNGGLTIGVLPFEKVGMEVGIDYRDISGLHDDPLYFNAKIGVPEDAFFKFMPALAVGGYDFGIKKDVTTYNLVYGLIAKNIWKLGRFSIGGYKGAVGSDPKIMFYVPSNPAKVDDAGLLVSWDRTISELSDKLWLAIDFQSGYNGYGAASLGLAWNFASNAGVILGYDIYNDGKALKPTVTIQFDANLW
jgi:hypothetical protein